MTQLAYRVVTEPLPTEEGGGYFAMVPDLPGCMSDGETPEETLSHVRDAIGRRVEAAMAEGRDVPSPTRRLAAAE